MGKYNNPEKIAILNIIEGYNKLPEGNKFKAKSYIKDIVNKKIELEEGKKSKEDMIEKLKEELLEENQKLEQEDQNLRVQKYEELEALEKKYKEQKQKIENEVLKINEDFKAKSNSLNEKYERLKEKIESTVKYNMLQLEGMNLEEKVILGLINTLNKLGASEVKNGLRSGIAGFDETVDPSLI